MAQRCQFESSNEVGVFANLTNSYALVALGVPPSRLRASFLRPGTGSLRTEFVVVPFEGVQSLGFRPAVAELTVRPEAKMPQEVRVPIVRETADLVVRLVNARAADDHWSSVLAVASGVPIVVRHKALGVEVLRATVYDGEVHLPGADIFYVGETYVVEVPETIRTLPATAEVMITPGNLIAERGSGAKRTTSSSSAAAPGLIPTSSSATSSGKSDSW